MTRAFKLLTLGVLCTWLLAGTSCEDQVCNNALQTCKKEASELRTECATNLSRISELKTQLENAQEKVDSLTKENDELKAKSTPTEAKVKSKGKGGKGKHKKRGKR
jgi:peptidoglycan hydrolase CwlO-like protein